MSTTKGGTPRKAILLALLVLNVLKTALSHPLNINNLVHVTEEVSSLGHVIAHVTEEVGSLGYVRADESVEKDWKHEEYIIGDEQFSIHRNGLRDKKRIWPGAVVPYVFSRDFPEVIKAKIREAMAEIENDVSSDDGKCVRFIPRTNERNYLDIVRKRGCHSAIGFYEMGAQETSLGPGCEEKGVIMHELIHTLGFYHEQNRYDRDNYIRINESNVNEKGKRDFRIRNDTVIDPHGVSYDWESIMHYGPYNMGANKTYPVITPRPELANGQMLGQRFTLTQKDVIKIQRQYSCKEDTSRIHSDIRQENLYSVCTFEDGLCGMHIKPASGNISAWIRISQMTPDGPKAGHTNGLDNFMYVSSNADLMDHLKTMEASKKITADSTKAPSNSASSRSPFLTEIYKSVTSYEGLRKSEQNPPNLPNMPGPFIDAKTEASPKSLLPKMPVPFIGGGDPQPLSIQEAPQRPIHKSFSASIFTPLVTSESDYTCLQFAAYQKGPSAYISIHINGPMFQKQLIAEYPGAYQDKWNRVRLSIYLPPGVVYQLELEAKGQEGAVAIDDFYMLKMKCP